MPGFRRYLAVLAIAIMVAGCGATAERGGGRHAGSDPGLQVVSAAQGVLGTPYRYGGASPARGFDCSGLVEYAYRQAGVSVPRTTVEQYRSVQRVRPAHLRPGDLVFFRLQSRRVSHVGIYAGDGRFIHAPSRGTPVSYARLDNGFWRSRLVGAGRVR